MGGAWRCKGDPPALGNTATGGEAIVDRLAAAGAAGAAVGSGDGGGGRSWSAVAAAACACSPCLPGVGATCSCSGLLTDGGGPRGAGVMTGGLWADDLLVVSNRGSRTGG